RTIQRSTRGETDIGVGIHSGGKTRRAGGTIDSMPSPAPRRRRFRAAAAAGYAGAPPQPAIAMSQRRFLQLDVFAARPGSGNPLAVIPDAEGLDAAAMQAIAAWLDLSETVFFLPPDDGADYRIRIFTPKMELPFAGHPSVGAAWAAVELGLATPVDGRLVQQCAAGLLPVRVQG